MVVAKAELPQSYSDQESDFLFIYIGIFMWCTLTQKKRYKKVRTHLPDHWRQGRMSIFCIYVDITPMVCNVELGFVPFEFSQNPHHTIWATTLTLLS